jgi:haloacetate dehalogenase
LLEFVLTTLDNTAMLDQFQSIFIDHAGVKLKVRTFGRGPALLLLHGHPQSMVMWHRVAPNLAQRFSVVLMDLRGYGDSQRPESDAAHATYSKRVMAQDALHVMRELGHSRFSVLAHDRGARVAHRLAADHPGAVQRLMLLDIAPTLAMYERTTQAFALAYWHWFFLVQPAPLPEALIEADPVRYVRYVMGRRHAGLGAFDPAALAEYERCARIGGTAHAICEDYRASASIDLVHDREDIAAQRRLQMPVNLLWGAHGAVGQCFDVLALWRERADDVRGMPLPCGHYIAEETPELLLAQVFSFFKDELQHG